jgi:hypothetical protein
MVLASRSISIRSEDVAELHRRVVDHGEDDDLAFLLCNTNRYVGWIWFVGWAETWAAAGLRVSCSAGLQRRGKPGKPLSLSYSFSIFCFDISI